MPRPHWNDGDEVTQADFDTMREDRERLSARVAELEEAAKDARHTRHDWERAHELLDAAGVLWTPEGEMGVHLVNRLKAALAVWEPIGRLSAQSCHDLRFLCNTPEEAIEAIKAHRAAFRRPE